MRDIVDIEAGRESSYYLTKNGVVHACGRNNEGQLGNDSRIDSDSPVRVEIPSGVKIKELGSGPSSAGAFFIGDDDLVYGVGQNYRHHVGIGVIGSQEVPALLEFDAPLGNFDIEKVSASGSHTVALACAIVTCSPTSFPTSSPSSDVSLQLTESLYFYFAQNPSLRILFLFGPQEPTFSPTTYPTHEPSVSPTAVSQSLPRSLVIAAHHAYF